MSKVSENELKDTWHLEGAEDSEITKIFLTTSKLNSNDFIEFVKSPKAGAVIYFGGTTRDSFESKEVTELSYEAHHRLALKSLHKIVLEMRQKFDDTSKDQFVHKVMIAHRLGVVPVMEDSVMIALSSTHRQEGWDAAVYLLEEIKSRVEIWKNEVYKDGSSSWKENDNSNVIEK